MLIKKFLLFSFHNPSTQTLNLCYICFRDVTNPGPKACGNSVVVNDQVI
jgi:hypothetical protein